MDSDIVTAEELMPGHKETAMATDHHAEHVGSLLRQPWLLDARARHQRGELGVAELRAAEDRAAAENIALQREAGPEIFTDGQVRPTNYRTRRPPRRTSC